MRKRRKIRTEYSLLFQYRFNENTSRVITFGISICGKREKFIFKEYFTQDTCRTDASRNEGNDIKNNEWEARKKIKCRGKKDVKEK